ncbi:MAG: ATP-binding protein [Bacteroidales bacterium]|nr:ATP-binding protein [Bacteroidales bacterium]
MNDLSLHILDITQNSIRAGASEIYITVNEDSATDKLTIEIRDNGKGIDKELVEKVTDPFFSTRSTRKIGMGLPLLKQNAEQCEGSLNIVSEKGTGTMVTAIFKKSHIDCPPMGNMAATIKSLLCSGHSYHLVYKHEIDGREFVFDSREISEILEGLNVNTPKIINFIKEMIDENLKNIGAS